jgi:hypothetical protein
MVYLLHFVDAKGHTLKLAGHASHYLGYTPDARPGYSNSRFQKHLTGRGAKITQAVVRAGGSFMWVPLDAKGDRKVEKKLKGQRNHKRFCPICRAEGRDLTHLDDCL